MDFSNFDLSEFTNWIVLEASSFSVKLVGAILTIIIGRFIISKIGNMIRKKIEKRDFEPTKVNFLLSLVKISLNVVLFVAAAGILGISTASLVTLIGAAGLAIGLALQGSLSNVAGGFLILILKPFKEGDVIEAQGVLGSVHKVNILNTVLKTPDNKTIYLPNASLASANITNYTEEPERRLDMTFGIGYSDDIDKARAVLKSIMDNDKRVIKHDGNRISITTLNDSSVDFTFRVRCKTEDYWDMYFDFQEIVKKEFDKNNISIPFPQRDVHLYQQN